MAVRIITDSTSDIAPGEQKTLGIEIVPLLVRFGQEEFVDGVTLTSRQFYDRLKRGGDLPATAQVSPERFERVFQKYGEEDEIVGIFLSSELSGTYQSALLAKKMLNRENIRLIDSRSVTFALGLLVYEAVRLRDRGCSAAEICDRITALTGRLRFYAVVDTLEYLRRGGRLSSASALVGTVLHVKPVITLKNGLVEAIDRQRGRGAALESVARLVRQDPPDPEYPVLFGDSVAPEMTDRLKETLRGCYAPENSRTLELGAVVGTHAGPGSAGLAYIRRDS